MYYSGEGRVYFSDSCPAAKDKNKTDLSSSTTQCVKDRLSTCNKIINRIAGVLTPWTLASPIVINPVNSSGSNSQAQLNTIYGVPSNIAVSLAQSLGLRSGIISSLRKQMFISFVSILRNSMFLSFTHCRKWLSIRWTKINL